MERINVLLVEDETNLALIIKDTLEGQDFNIHTASNGEEGLRLFFDIRPDVLVADVMMPRMDGFEMVRRIRQTDRRTPVLFLTARSAVNDVVEGFELGANDYLKKPFGMQELIVRIKALVGRACSYTSPVQEEQSLYEIGNYQLDVRRQVLLYNGITHRNCVVNTQDILLDLWGDDSFFNQRSLHVFITKLRHKLAKDESIRIVNVRGIGYKLIG